MCAAGPVLIAMIIVSGHLSVPAETRDEYVAGCRDVVAAARATAGCLDFAISVDPLDAERINVLEPWEGRQPLDAFRGGGSPESQLSQIRSMSIAEYDVAGSRGL